MTINRKAPASGARNPEELLQTALNMRGYIVIDSIRRLSPGQIIDDVDMRIYPEDPPYRPGYKLHVVEETDRADFVEQSRALGVPIPSDVRWAPLFYRVIIE